MAKILTFPAKASTTKKAPLASRMQIWADQHIPLIDVALDLHKTDAVEFRKRCLLIAETEGRSVLKKMATQLDRLAAHVTIAVEALSMTSQRIRRLLAEGSGA